MDLDDVDVPYGHVTLLQTPLGRSLAHGVASEAEEVLSHGIREISTHVLGQDLNSLILKIRETIIS